MPIFAPLFIKTIRSIMRYPLILGFLLFFGYNILQAQTGDPVLFTVDGTPVPASEFSYIYSKNNRDDADFSEKAFGNTWTCT